MNAAPPLGETPLVSIVMPAYNTSRFIDETLASIRAQTYPHWELIVIDDASTDATPERVREAARLDPRIRLVRLEKNGGPGPARNVGMAEARGRLLAFQDSEDLWTADRLERQIAFMRAHDAALTVCSYSMIDERGRPVGRPVRMPERIEYATLLKNTIIAVITTLADRERVGPLVMPPLPQHEDLVMWFGVLKRGVVAHGMPDVLARYRLVGGSASRDKWRSARRMWRVYRRVEGLSVPRAAWCYANYAWNAWRKYRR